MPDKVAKNRRRPMNAVEMQRLSARARMENLSPEERSALARRAVQVRWKRYRAQRQGKGAA
jgi:hypothetical protein